MYVCMGFIALITVLVLCARSQDSLLSVSVRRAHIVFSTSGFKDEGKTYPKARETAALWRDIQGRTADWYNLRSHYSFIVRKAIKQ